MNEGHIQGPRNQLSEEYLKHGDFLLSSYNFERTFECPWNDTSLSLFRNRHWARKAAPRLFSQFHFVGYRQERDGIFLRRPQSELTSRRHLTSYFNVLSAREFPHFYCSHDVLSQVFYKRPAGQRTGTIRVNQNGGHYPGWLVNEAAGTAGTQALPKVRNVQLAACLGQSGYYTRLLDML